MDKESFQALVRDDLKIPKKGKDCITDDHLTRLMGALDLDIDRARWVQHIHIL